MTNSTPRCARPCSTSSTPRRDEPALLPLFDAMAGSRLLDIQARRMRERGQGFYTIGSAGHESNALVAEALRADRPGAAALPLRRVLPGPRAAGRTPARRRRCAPCCSACWPATADPASGGRHKVFGDAGAGRHPADVDDRLAPAARARRRLRHRPGPAAAAVDARWPRRRRHRLQLRRRQHQPLDRGRRAQHRRLLRDPGSAAAAGVRLRGQRHRHLGAHPRRAGSPGRRAASGHRVPRRRRRRPGRGAAAPRARRPSTVRAHAPPGAAAPAHRALPRPRRHRRRDRLPRRRRDHRRPRARPAARAGPRGSATAPTWPRRYDEHRRAGRASSPPSWPTPPTLTDADAVMAPLRRARRPGRRGAPARRPEPAWPPSAAGCPRTPGR